MFQDAEKTGRYFNSLPYASDRPLLIKDLAKLWFIDIKKVMRPSSYSRYRSNAGKYILPYIGDMEASSFDRNTLLDVLGFLRSEDYKEGPVSQYTVYILEGMVRSMFRYGAENKLVPEIYFGKQEYTIVSKKYAMPLSELEVHQLTHTIEEQSMDLQVQVMLPLYAGLSLSEMCGLKWNDINLETGKIYVHRNIMRVQKEAGPADKGATVMAEYELPENECREFLMPEKLNILLRTIACQKKISQESYVAELDKKEGRGRKPQNSSDSIDSKLLPPDGRTLQYRLKTAGKQAGVHELTFQSLRDTFVVMCLKAGGDVYSVAYVLGINVSAVCERYKRWIIKKDAFLKGI